MPAAAEGPDTEDLKISPFARGEWSQDERIMLDVSFMSLAAVLGDEDDPLESIAVSRLLAIAYAVGWSSKMLMVSPTDFAGELEAAIDARGGLVDIGATADANLATAQAVATDQIHQRAWHGARAANPAAQPNFTKSWTTGRTLFSAETRKSNLRIVL